MLEKEKEIIDEKTILTIHTYMNKTPLYNRNTNSLLTDKFPNLNEIRVVYS